MTGEACNASASSAFPLRNFSPEELTLLAPLIGIALAQSLNDDDALLLGSFISNISSAIGLFVTQRSHETVEEIPGIVN